MKTLHYGRYNKINFYPEAPADWVKNCFELGNILCIYPSKDLKEIAQLPADVRKAVKRYTEVVKTTNIYISDSIQQQWNGIQIFNIPSQPFMLSS